MTNVAWVDVLIIVAAVLTASWTIWRKGLKPFIQIVNHVAEAVPILAEIAKEFKPNEGTSLRDVVEAIHQDITTIREVQLLAQVRANEGADHFENLHHALRETQADIMLQLRNIQQEMLDG